VQRIIDQYLGVLTWERLLIVALCTIIAIIVAVYYKRKIHYFEALEKLYFFELQQKELVQEREQLLINDEEYPFIFKVAAEVTLRMGGRPKGPTELKAARLLAWRIMKSTDHRISHCERDVPKVLMLLTKPTETEELVDYAVESGLIFDRTHIESVHSVKHLLPYAQTVLYNNN
jgi:hypothetical protein